MIVLQTEPRRRTLNCVTCGKAFARQGARGPVPKYCSPACGRVPHRQRRSAYDRARHPRYYAEHRRRILEAGHRRYATDEYRRYALARYYEMQDSAEIRAATIQHPYTGHRWLEMASRAAGGYVDPTAPWADDRFDEMGEALLALLEGRDPKLAVKEYRSREYVSRSMTTRISEWSEDERTQGWERFFPAPRIDTGPEQPEEPVQLTTKGRFHMGKGKYRKEHPVRKRRRES